MYPKHNLCFLRRHIVVHIYHLKVWTFPEFVYFFDATQAFLYAFAFFDLTFVFCNVGSGF